MCGNLQNLPLFGPCAGSVCVCARVHWRRVWSQRWTTTVEQLPKMILHISWSTPPTPLRVVFLCKTQMGRLRRSLSRREGASSTTSATLRKRTSGALRYLLQGLRAPRLRLVPIDRLLFFPKNSREVGYRFSTRGGTMTK